MAYSRDRTTASPPESWADAKEHSRKIAQSVRGVMDGQLNNHYSVTLEAGTTQTDVVYPTARPGVTVLLTPQNQLAASFQRANDVWTTSEIGKVTIHHASAAGGEQFSLAIFG